MKDRWDETLEKIYLRTEEDTSRATSRLLSKEIDLDEYFRQIVDAIGRYHVFLVPGGMTVDGFIEVVNELVELEVAPKAKIAKYPPAKFKRVVASRVAFWRAEALKRERKQNQVSKILPISRDVASKAPVVLNLTRRQRVDAYIEECKGAGVSIKRADIWGSAGYKEATQFERWQKGDLPDESQASQNFERILAKKPHLTKPIEP